MGPTHVLVRIDYRGPLNIEVVDAGTSSSWRPDTSTGGYGLLGMRERVALFGGELQAGPEGAGFAVRVQLPLPVLAR